MPIAFPPFRAIALALILTGLIALQCSIARAAETAPTGTWLTHAGDARIQVSRCGSDLCGKVVWLREPIDRATGRAPVDDKNRDPSLRSRPILGLQLFLGMKPAGAGTWSGEIYNADDGQTYASTVTVIDNDRLQIRGCVAILCGSEIWTRASRS